MPGGTPGPQGWEWGRAWSAGRGLRGRAPFLALLAAGSREVVGVGCWILECKAEGRPGPLSPPAARQPPSELTGGILVPTGPGPWGKPQSSVGGAFFTTPPSCSRLVDPRQPPLALTAWAPGPMWWEQQPRPAWLWVFSFFLVSLQAGIASPRRLQPRAGGVQRRAKPRVLPTLGWGARCRCLCSLQGALRSAQQVPPGRLGRQLRDVVSRAWTSGHSSRGRGNGERAKLNLASRPGAAACSSPQVAGKLWGRPGAGTGASGR